MCGFVANLSADIAGCEKLMPALRQATDLLAHRGPDDEAFYVSSHFSAGFRRLKIIDLSDDARQPMGDPTGRFWIIFNGEIYNYRELRETLEQHGVLFRTASDTEVLLNSYIHWGQDCLNRLNGMFAFLIWDKNEKTLFGARDRFGEKPLYWTKKNNCLFFASEIKALFPLIGDVPRPNMAVVRHYLQGRQADSAVESFFEGIQSVPPAYKFVVADGDLRFSQYWQLNASEIESDDPIGRIRELFFDSVKLRMRADVPVGTCLSGGIDSGAIACTIAQSVSQSSHSDRHTFTAAYSEYDESDLVSEINKKTNSTGHSIVPRPSSLSDLTMLLKYHDEPFHSFTAFAGFQVMKLARDNNVVVLLNGQGADELLAGYPKYIDAYLRDLMFRGKIWAAFKVAGQASRLTGKSASASLLNSTTKATLSGIRRMMESSGIQASRRDRFASQTLGLLPEFCEATKDIPLTQSSRFSGGGRLKQRLYDSLTVAHLPLYLRVEDRNSMANSLESRLPFLDHRLAEFAFSLPMALFMKNGTNKYLFREAMAGILPDSVRLRKEKFGFPTPETDWIFGHLNREITDLLESDDFESRSIFNVSHVKEMFRSDTVKWRSSPQAISSVIRSYWFRLVALELWFRTLDHWRTSITTKQTSNPKPMNIVNSIESNYAK